MAIGKAWSDGELISLIKQNNQAGFGYLYGNYAAALYCCIKGLVNDSHVAEEIMRDTVMNIWNQIGTYDPANGCLYTWMQQLAGKRATDFLQHGAKYMGGERIYNEDCTTAETYYVGHPGGHGTIAATLPLDPKALICLVYHSKHSIKDIAHHLNIPAATITTRLRAAIVALRNEYATAV